MVSKLLEYYSGYKTFRRFNSNITIMENFSCEYKVNMKTRLRDVVAYLEMIILRQNIHDELVKNFSGCQFLQRLLPQKP